jgi:acyl carrier protein
MEQEEILQKVTVILVENLGVDAAEVKMESRFLDDLGADSIMLAEIIMNLEDAYHIRISDEDAFKIKTVGDAVHYIAQLGETKLAG